MSSSVQPVLKDLAEAIGRLENVIEDKLEIAVRGQTEMDLGAGQDLNTVIASKLDNTISRLETLLSEE